MIQRIYSIILLYLCFVCIPAYADDAQMLHMRRIKDLWQMEDLEPMKLQAKEFFALYPNSPFKDQILVFAGDAEWRQGNFREALRIFDRIQTRQFSEAVFTRKADSLYRLGEDLQLQHLLEDRIHSISNENLVGDQPIWIYYYAEVLSREGRKQNQQALVHKAIAYYQRILNTPMSPRAKLGLAGAWASIGQRKQASQLYLELAQQWPDQKDSLIMLAGQLQASYDSNAAIATLAQMKNSASARTSAANCQRIALLFQKGQFEEIIDARSALEQGASSEDLLCLHYYLGRSYYHLGEFEQAISLLQPLLGTHLDNDKCLLMILTASSASLKRLDQVRSWVAQYQRKFSADNGLAKILLLQARAEWQGGNAQRAATILEQIATAYPYFEELADVFLDRALLAQEQRDWSTSRRWLLSLVSRFPDSRHKTRAFEYIVRSDLSQMQCEDKFDRQLLEQLSQDLKNALEQGDISQELRSSYQLQLAKTEYQLQKYAEAIAHLNRLLHSQPDNAQAHLLLGYILLAQSGDPHAFICEAEKSLTLQPDLPDSVHQHLFHAYLQRNREKDKDLAAAHLMLLLAKEHADIPNSSRLWMGGYFHDRLRQIGNEFQPEPLPTEKARKAAERAISIVVPALDKSDHEEGFLQLGAFYGWAGFIEKQAAVYEALVMAYHQGSERSWKMVPRTLFALGNAYEQLGRGESALACYNQIITVEPYLQQATKLRIARLKILQGKEKIESLLNELNQLQINKSLNTEPVHLEAAYDYAKYYSRGDLKRLLKLLGAAKEAFTSQKDIPAKEYHALRGTNQRLDHVYQAYLMLFDARIAQTEGDLAKRKDPVEASRKYAIAKELYETLLSEKFAISKYLVDQAQSSLLTLQGNT